MLAVQCSSRREWTVCLCALLLIVQETARTGLMSSRAKEIMANFVNHVDAGGESDMEEKGDLNRPTPRPTEPSKRARPPALAAASKARRPPTKKAKTSTGPSNLLGF